MIRRCAAIVIALLAAALTPGAVTNANGPIETPDPGFLGINGVGGDVCQPQTPYEVNNWSQLEGPYGSKCRRLHFVFGPINVKAGQMDGAIQPVTIEKPAYSGYLVRFKPDLKNADGSIPDITDVHLHHGTWLNGSPQYGNGPFFAAGEEKTIMDLPGGYGMHVGATDTWLLLYMVHNQTAQPKVEYITYDVDFVADSDATTLGIAPVRPIWLDVQRQPISADAPNRSAYPVFNVQRGFGHVDPLTGRHVCTWPRENCARFDSFSQVTPQQGKPEPQVQGGDWTVPANLSGTLIGLGGHLHPGGVRDEVSVVRGGQEKMIFRSDAVPWSRSDPTQAGGPLNSWDFSMTVTGSPYGWKVKIAPGDIVRVNAVYDNSVASWYENMGIVVAFVAPNDTHAPAGVDVFNDPVNLVDGVPTGSLPVPGWDQPSCTADLTSATKTLCLRGTVTHGHLPEASHFGGCPATGCGVVDAKPGQLTSEIVAAGFTYTNADLGTVGTTGIPQVKLGQPLRFYNADTAADIWHTFTLCQEGTAVACDGNLGLDYPLASGGNGSPTDLMDFDSSELGYGLYISSGKGQIGGSDFPQGTAADGAYWDFTPTQAGTYQFFCRVHPSMRGVFQVIP